MENENFQTFIDDCKRLTAMLSDDEISHALHDFISSTTHAVEQMGIDREDVTGDAHPGSTSIVPLQEKPIKIGSVATMEPDEILWTVMMFSLLDGKLYKENYHCGELSYTSDMIADPAISTELIAYSGSGALMVKDYKPLVATILTAQSIENTEQYSKYKDSGLNNWLYDRYKDQVPVDILNGLLPSDGSALFMLPDNTPFLAPSERVDRSHLGPFPNQSEP